MSWEVRIDERVKRRVTKLPEKVRRSLRLLMREIEAGGPVRGNWPNHAKLGNNRHHCHLKKGRPTYVSVWEQAGDDIKLVEVIYVGTHEKAPY